ncbi:hypothetical protein FH688_08645 [Streptococcus suis]|nr:hypothetical protein FH688_08645 [Streptococcus suis]TQE79690.1 hypothetical protein FH693_09055 [Streptococcus suis]
MRADYRQLVSPTSKGLPDLLNSHPVQLKLSGRQFEVGNEANFVRISRRGQIWSVKRELLRFALQIPFPTFNSLPDC